MDQTKQRQLLIILFVSSIVAGFSGYFVGKYFDTKANDQLIVEAEEAAAKLLEEQETGIIVTTSEFSYLNENFKFEIFIPEGWEYLEIDNSTEILSAESGLEDTTYDLAGTFTVKSPSNSVFIYKIYDQELSDTNIRQICGVNDENTDVNIEYISDCVDKETYARFLSKDEGEDSIWRIATFDEEIDEINYTYAHYDGFYFELESDEDLVLMDQIAASIRRW